MRIIALSSWLALISSASHAQQLSDVYRNAVGVAAASDMTPSSGTILSAAPGDLIAKTRTYNTASGAVTLSPVQSPAKFPLPISIAAGVRLFEVVSSRPFKACSIELNSQGWPTCLIDDDGDGQFDRIARSDTANAAPLEAKVLYRREAAVELPSLTGGFQRALIYQGSTSEGLSISYREFSGDYARPAFEERLSIPIGKTFPQQFAVKGLVFTAISVGAMGLQYRLDSVSEGRGWPTPR